MIVLWDIPISHIISWSTVEEKTCQDKSHGREGGKGLASCSPIQCSVVKVAALTESPSDGLDSQPVADRAIPAGDKRTSLMFVVQGHGIVIDFQNPLLIRPLFW